MNQTMLATPAVMKEICPEIELPERTARLQGALICELPPQNDALPPEEAAIEESADSCQLMIRAEKLSKLHKCLEMNLFRSRTECSDLCYYSDVQW